jgi:broad specificity phosphatase PhoE
MAKTVIGLFDNLGAAQAALRELAGSGIAEQDIGFMADQRHQVPSTAHLNESEGEGADDALGIVVTVAADQPRTTDRARAILERHGAVDIDERDTEWKKQGWKGRFEAD